MSKLKPWLAKIKKSKLISISFMVVVQQGFFELSDVWSYQQPWPLNFNENDDSLIFYLSVFNNACYFVFLLECQKLWNRNFCIGTLCKNLCTPLHKSFLKTPPKSTALCFQSVFLIRLSVPVSVSFTFPNNRHLPNLIKRVLQLITVVRSSFLCMK